MLSPRGGGGRAIRGDLAVNVIPYLGNLTTRAGLGWGTLKSF